MTGHDWTTSYLCIVQCHPSKCLISCSCNPVRNGINMPATFEILILVLMSMLLVFQVNNTTGAGGISMKQLKSGKVNEEKYVQYVSSAPILSMPSANIQFDGDVYFASDDLTWDWNESPQQPSEKPALYLADPFINIQHVPGQFQPMF